MDNLTLLTNTLASSRMSATGSAGWPGWEAPPADQPIPGLEATNASPSLEQPLEGGPVAPAFADVLNGFLGQVDAAQHKSDAMVESLALGEPVDVHQVMLSLNEASNALQLTLQVRGKVLEAYQDLMRMPF